MSTKEKDPLKEVLEAHDVTLSDLRFISLTGANLHIDRAPLRETIRRGNETFTEIRVLEPFAFEDGFYPRVGETLTEDEARELVTSPFFDEVLREKKNLFRVAPKAPTGSKSIDEQIEERAEERFQQMLKQRGIKPAKKSTKKTKDDGKTDDPPPGDDNLEVITGVSTKQEAVEALASRSVDVSFASNLANTTVADIVAKATEAGYAFDGWGD